MPPKGKGEASHGLAVGRRHHSDPATSHTAPGAQTQGAQEAGGRGLAGGGQGPSGEHPSSAQVAGDSTNSPDLIHGWARAHLLRHWRCNFALVTQPLRLSVSSTINGGCCWHLLLGCGSELPHTCAGPPRPPHTVGAQEGLSNAALLWDLSQSRHCSTPPLCGTRGSRCAGEWECKAGRTCPG